MKRVTAVGKVKTFISLSWLSIDRYVSFKIYYDVMNNDYLCDAYKNTIISKNDVFFVPLMSYIDRLSIHL